MNPLKAFTTPEYLFRPRQVLVRLQRAVRKPKQEREAVVLPWGETLLVHPNEVIGSNIWFYGIFDTIVAEAICRLLDPSELAVDVGANLGLMTSLMRFRAGPQGRVVAFEPHPELFAELTENCSYSNSRSLAPVEVYEVALSDEDGEGLLELGPHWDCNRGLARISSENAAAAAQKFKVNVRTLDSLFQKRRQIAVCKIDVEGHELQVFRGAQRLLQAGDMRDIIFEDFGAYPTETQKMLQGYGFTLFSLHPSLFRPRLALLVSQPSFNPTREGFNFLATLAPERALERFKAWGWKVLIKPCL
jgi:FkbM family methyltransferase